MLKGYLRRVGVGMVMIVAISVTPVSSAWGADPGSVTGHVQGAGFVVSDLTVSIGYGSWSVHPDATGDYSVTGVPAGTYPVQLAFESDTEYYTDEAGWVTVAAGTSTTKDIDYTAVQGTVTGDGAPVANVNVDAYAPGDPGDGPAEYTLTDAAGAYRMLVVADGYDHFINFNAGVGWVSEYFDDAATVASATAVPYSASAVSVADAELARSATLRGHLTLPAGATAADRTVHVFSADTREVVEQSYVPRSGDYRVRGLAPGSYILSFGRASGIALAPGTYYRSVSEGAGSGSAQALTVSTGEIKILQSTTISKASGGSLAGKIYKLSNGKRIPRANLRMVAVPVDGSGSATLGVTPLDKVSTRSAITKRDGSFVITGLSPHKYNVYVWNSSYPIPGERGYRQLKLGVWRVKAGSVVQTGAHRFDARSV